MTAGLVAVALAWAAFSARAGQDDEILMAGAASVEVSLPVGTPLAGYGGFPRRAWVPDVLGRHPYAFWFRPSLGVHDPLRVRALALESGEARALWLTLDLVGIDPTLVAGLRERLRRRGQTYSALIVSASHTHSGPGAYAESALFGFVAIDRLSPPIRTKILDGLEEAAWRAEGAKMKAQIAVGSVSVTGITESRVHEALDPELAVVKVTRTDGRPLALLWNYAIHGTALGRDNLLLSGDLMGDASARLERETGVPALFVNGAVGDVSPRPRGWAGVQAAGQTLAAGALEAWRRARVEPGGVEVATGQVALPSPALSVRNCVAGWAPTWMTVGLQEALPTSTDLVALRIARTGWVTIPGELETRLGLDVKSTQWDRLGRVFIAGVSNDYLGYFLTPADYRKPSYIACASLYGERGGEVMRDAAVAALKRLDGGRTRR